MKSFFEGFENGSRGFSPGLYGLFDLGLFANAGEKRTWNYTQLGAVHGGRGWKKWLTGKPLQSKIETLVS
jgi:hypothetical protein